MTDTVLVLAWLVVAHLVADFVLQNDWIALNKGTGGRTGWSALGVHGFHVGLCLLPFALAYGLPALAYIAVVVGSHVLVDRWKVQATRRAERAALDAARARLAANASTPSSGLGNAWTPWPGMLFLADQALHLTIALVGWLVLLEGVPLLQGWVDAVNLVLRTWDRAAVHVAVLTGLVLVSLFLVNTRAAYYFVLALVSPRELPPDRVRDLAPAPVPAAGDVSGHMLAVPAPGPTAAVERAPAPARRGPADPQPASGAASVPPAPAVPTGARARIAATAGALERLLIVAFVLAGAEIVVGLVIVAKVIARLRELEDRGFAEYFLLETFASGSVAVLSAIVARAALGTLP